MEKAYDTVYQPAMWQILRIYDVPDALIFVLMKLYLDIFIKLKGCGKNIRITSTVCFKHGKNLAPILFVLFINALGESISPEWERAGIEVTMIQYYKQDQPKEARHGHSPATGASQGDPLEFFNSYYVNDSYFLTLSGSAVEKATSLIINHFRRFLLKIHFGIRYYGKAPNTEAMFIPGMHRGYKKYTNISLDLVADINLDSEFLESSQIRFVECFKYLG